MPYVIITFLFILSVVMTVAEMSLVFYVILWWHLYIVPIGAMALMKMTLVHILFVRYVLYCNGILTLVIMPFVTFYYIIFVPLFEQKKLYPIFLRFFHWFFGTNWTEKRDNYKWNISKGKLQSLSTCIDGSRHPRHLKKYRERNTKNIFDNICMFLNNQALSPTRWHHQSQV
jgi:hypothetical protein